METELKQRLLELGSGYKFFFEMQRLSQEAASGDAKANQTLISMLGECNQADAWSSRNYWCSAVLRSIVSSGTDSGYAAICKFTEGLSLEIPPGALELLSSLLPVYGTRSHDWLRKLSSGPADNPCAQVAVQTLCNLFLEGRLKGEESDNFTKFIKSYQPRDYLTQNIRDLALMKIPGTSDSELDMDAFLKDVIVEG